LVDGIRLLCTKCSLFKCNQLDRDIVQATIRPNTPIKWLFYVLCTSVSYCSFFDIRFLIALKILLAQDFVGSFSRVLFPRNCPSFLLIVRVLANAFLVIG